MTQSRKLGSDKHEDGTEKENMSKRRIKNTPIIFFYIGQKRYADRQGGKEKDKNKSKQRWIGGEIDEPGN